MEISKEYIERLKFLANALLEQPMSMGSSEDNIKFLSQLNYLLGYIEALDLVSSEDKPNGSK